MDVKFELKKCPFCGGEAQMIIAKADTKLYGVECKRCHVLMGHTVNNSTEFFTMPLYAADAWNQRAAHLPETKADIPMPEVKEPKKSSQAAAGHWILTSEAVPDSIQNVFVCYYNYPKWAEGKPVLCYSEAEYMPLGGFHGWGLSNKKIIAWMPIPELDIDV